MKQLAKETAHNFIEARALLIAEERFMFFGGLVMSLVPFSAEPEHGLSTMAIDQRGVMLINEDWFNGLPLALRMSGVAHEAMHCAFEHHGRMGLRNQTVWNEATDLFINTMLWQNGLKIDENWVTITTVGRVYNVCFPDNLCHTHSPEMIYNKLMDATNGQGANSGNPLAGDIMPGISDGEIGNADNEGTAEIGGKRVPLNPDWRTIIRGAASAADSAGVGSMPGSERRRLGLEPPRVAWESVLASFFVRNAGSAMLTYAKPRRRMSHVSQTLSANLGGLPVFPSMIPDKPEIVFGFDTSGSMTSVLNKMMGELSACQRITRSSVWMLAGDSKKQYDMVIQPGAGYPQDVGGGGGTSFNWFFKAIRESAKPNLGGIVFLTDGYSWDQVDKSNYPTLPMLWIVYNNKDYQPQFGSVVHISD